MPRSDAELDILRAAALWKDRCVIEDGSVFTDRQIWTPENVAQLDRYFVKNLDYTEGGFWHRLERQLAPTTPDAKQLAAEIFWVMYLIAYRASMTGETKREQIHRVWEWSGNPFPDNHPLMGTVLDEGVANPGQSYNTNRWREFKFFIELLDVLKAMPTAERRQRLADPWGFGEWLDGLEISAGRTLRHVLLYLLFPTHYYPIVVSSHKQDIVRSFRRQWGQADGDLEYKNRLAMDQALLAVVERLREQYRTDRVDFYRDPLIGVWREPEEPTEDGDPDEAERWYRATFGHDVRTWAVAAGEGARAWDEFKRDKIIAIGWDYLGDLREYDGAEKIKTAIAEERGVNNPVMDTLACWQFAHEMKPGDQVIVKKGGSTLLGWGVIRSEYRYDPARAEMQHVREVEWLKVGQWRLDSQHKVNIKTVTDFTSYKPWLKYAWDLVGGAREKIVSPPKGGEPYGMNEALNGLFMSVDTLRDILDTLGRRKNVILQGPPGVGKTFAARRIAYALINYKRPQQVEMVQFHQSYAYEDFIQGWRPQAGGGFILRNGVFFSFCNLARKNPGDRFVFIIDEINRGNLSKVFGEVMMLIEADKRGEEYAVPLTYSPEEHFFIPSNLFVIGLMNTADRSLAMIDYALRRRFGFISLMPAFNEDEFSNTLSEAGASGDLIKTIRERLNELNDKIASDPTLGRGFQIGHSFFVPQGEEVSLDESWYRSVVNNELKPLLEEYWFDDPDKVGTTTRRLLE